MQHIVEAILLIAVPSKQGNTKGHPCINILIKINARYGIYIGEINQLKRLLIIYKYIWFRLLCGAVPSLRF